MCPRKPAVNTSPRKLCITHHADWQAHVPPVPAQSPFTVQEMNRVSTQDIVGTALLGQRKTIRLLLREPPTLDKDDL